MAVAVAVAAVVRWWCGVLARLVVLTLVPGAPDVVQDHHGAVVIPKAVAAKIPGAVDIVLRREKVILDARAEPGFNAEKLRIAMADSADIH